jgi:HK97 family phage major capsid protein
MDSSVTGSASDYLTVYGDFQNFVVASRIGTTIELVPHLFGANRRPTAQRSWLMWRRVGSDSVNDNAFKMLDKSA